MAETAEVSEFKKSRDRSPSFPFISLETALRRAQEFYSFEKRGSAPYSVAAEHWRYSPASSGALQTVAALKQYGLMVDEGSGQMRKVKLTDLALRIILDSRADSTERTNYMRQAARMPPIVEEIYRNWPDGLPSDSTLNHHLVLELQFNEQTAAKAVKIIKENYAFTGESGDAMLSEISNSTEDSMSGRDFPVAADRSQIDVVDAGVISTRPGRVPHGALKASNVVATERVKAKGIDIELRFSEEPTADAFRFLSKYIALRIADLTGADDPPADKQEGAGA